MLNMYYTLRSKNQTYKTLTRSIALEKFENSPSLGSNSPDLILFNISDIPSSAVFETLKFSLFYQKKLCNFLDPVWFLLLL